MIVFVGRDRWGLKDLGVAWKIQNAKRGRDREREGINLGVGVKRDRGD